jgi:hypothetical protein
MSVAYDTTRSRGVRVSMRVEDIAKFKRKYAFQFVTHRYENPFNVELESIVFPLSYEYEIVFLEVINSLAKRLSAELTVSHRNFPKTGYRAMSAMAACDG